MLLVFGSVNADLVFEVERLPAPGETVLCPHYTFAHGGKGANQATAAAKAGASVRFAGCVGHDPYGRVLRAGLEDAGVDTSLLREVDGPSGTAVIGVDRAGENAIIVAGGANLAVRAAQVPDEALGPGVTLLCQNEVPAAETAALLQRAKALGSRTVLNFAPAGAIDEATLRALDLLVVNEGELARVADAPGDAAGRAAGLHRGFGCSVVVTLGARGALAAHDGELLLVPALAVRAVDTTGAGDTFAGVLAAALDLGHGLEAALARASVAGALACTALGARSGQPDRAAIEAGLADLPPSRRVPLPASPDASLRG